jgi:hypothetical protein
MSQVRSEEIRKVATMVNRRERGRPRTGVPSRSWFSRGHRQWMECTTTRHCGGLSPRKRDGTVGSVTSSCEVNGQESAQEMVAGSGGRPQLPKGEQIERTTRQPGAKISQEDKRVTQNQGLRTGSLPKARCKEESKENIRKADEAWPARTEGGLRMTRHTARTPPKVRKARRTRKEGPWRLRMAMSELCLNSRSPASSSGSGRGRDLMRVCKQLL